MTLIQLEQDDKEILRAEDEAIRATQDPSAAAPDDIAALIERLTNGDTQVPNQG